MHTCKHAYVQYTKLLSVQWITLDIFSNVSLSLHFLFWPMEMIAWERDKTATSTEPLFLPIFESEVRKERLFVYLRWTTLLQLPIYVAFRARRITRIYQMYTVHYVKLIGCSSCPENTQHSWIRFRFEPIALWYIARVYIDTHIPSHIQRIW